MYAKHKCVLVVHSYTVSWLDSWCSSLIIFIMLPVVIPSVCYLQKKRNPKIKWRKKRKRKRCAHFVSQEKKILKNLINTIFMWNLSTSYIHDIYSPWHHPGKWADVWLDLMLLKFLLYVVISFTVIWLLFFLVTNYTFRYFSLVMRWRKEMNLLTTNLHMKCTML